MRRRKPSLNRFLRWLSSPRTVTAAIIVLVVVLIIRISSISLKNIGNASPPVTTRDTNDNVEERASEEFVISTTQRYHVHFLAIGDEVVAGQYRTKLFGQSKDFRPFYEAMGPMLMNQTRQRDSSGGLGSEKPAITRLVNESEQVWLEQLQIKFAASFGGHTKTPAWGQGTQPMSKYFFTEHLAEISGLIARPFAEVADIVSVTSSGVTLGGATSAVLYNGLHGKLLSFPTSGPLVRDASAHRRLNGRSGKHQSNGRHRGEAIPEAPWKYNDPEEIELRKKDAVDAANAYVRRPVGPRAGGWQTVKERIGRLFAERVAEAEEWPADHWYKLLKSAPPEPPLTLSPKREEPTLPATLDFQYPFRHNDTIVIFCGVMAGAYDAMTFSSNAEAAKLDGHQPAEANANDINNNAPRDQFIHAAMGTEDSLDYLALSHGHCLGYFYYRLSSWINSDVSSWDTKFATPPKTLDDPRIRRYIKERNAGGAVADEQNKVDSSDKKSKGKKGKKKLSGGSSFASSLSQLGIHVKVISVPMETTTLALDPYGPVMSSKVAPVLDSPLSSREVMHCFHKDGNGRLGDLRVTVEDVLVNRMRREFGHAWRAIHNANTDLDAAIARGALHERVSDMIDQRGWNTVSANEALKGKLNFDGDEGFEEDERKNNKGAVEKGPQPTPAIFLFGHRVEFLVSPLPPPSFRIMLAPTASDEKLWLWSDCFRLMPDGSAAVARTVCHALRRIMNAMAPLQYAKDVSYD